MKIGILADTHASSLAELPDKILSALVDVDLIIHAGDFTTRGVLDGLRQMGKVLAVHGNMDSGELQQLLPAKEYLSVQGHRLGITHGWGSPDGIEERVRPLLHDADIIIFGHSHYAQNKIIDGTLFFNPGRARESFGILTVGEQVSGEIINVGE